MQVCMAARAGSCGQAVDVTGVPMCLCECHAMLRDTLRVPGSLLAVLAACMLAGASRCLPFRHMRRMHTPRGAHCQSRPGSLLAV